MTQKFTDVLEHVLESAAKSGASAADVVLSDSASVSVGRRLGKPESLVRSEETEIGLRVFVGRQMALVSSSDIAHDKLDEMAARAVAMAKVAPEDPHAGIADPDQLSKEDMDLDIAEDVTLTPSDLADLADRGEAAALNVKDVTNSEGAQCTAGYDTTWYAASNGFLKGYRTSGYNLTVSVIAGEGMDMQTDYGYDYACFFEDLATPEDIGLEAAKRAVDSLNPRKGTTKNIPVVFDQRLSGGLIGSLAGGISGRSVARGTTFLKNRMHEQIFAKGITIVDDPFLKRGLRSRPFDGEGLAPSRREIIADGVLTGWFLDLASARQLGVSPTGNAVRSPSGPPSPRPSNFTMQNGTMTLQNLIGDIEEGLYVTSLMGAGGNMITGDYSRGAQGFWIENGEITYPVSEMTIAGNLQEMWRNLTPANDLRRRAGVDAPSIRVDGMMVAGV